MTWPNVYTDDQRRRLRHLLGNDDDECIKAIEIAVSIYKERRQKIVRSGRSTPDRRKEIENLKLLTRQAIDAESASLSARKKLSEGLRTVSATTRASYPEILNWEFEDHGQSLRPSPVDALIKLFDSLEETVDSTGARSRGRPTDTAKHQLVLFLDHHFPSGQRGKYEFFKAALNPVFTDLAQDQIAKMLREARRWEGSTGIK